LIAVLSSATIRLVLDLPKMNSKLLNVGCLGHHVSSEPVADHSPTGLKAMDAIQSMGISVIAIAAKITA
jgi:hypothetical protein